MKFDTYLYVVQSVSALECAIDDFEKNGCINHPFYMVLKCIISTLDHIIIDMRRLSFDEKESSS